MIPLYKEVAVISKGKGECLLYFLALFFMCYMAYVFVNFEQIFHKYVLIFFAIYWRGTKTSDMILKFLNEILALMHMHNCLSFRIVKPRYLFIEN